jgi:hypothetical protein
VDHRGDPFENGAPIPYPKGSKEHHAIEIFAGCKLPLTEKQFQRLGGDLEALWCTTIRDGHVQPHLVLPEEPSWP